MRTTFMIFLILSGMFSGCFSDDDLLLEDPGIPGGLTLACLKNDISKMIVEIDYESGRAPATESIQVLKQRLDSVCDKPGGITVTTTLTTFSDRNEWTADDVRDEARKTREAGPLENDGILRWHIIMPKGYYEQDSVLGVAVDASSVALFQDAIEDAEGLFGRPSAEEVQKAVMVHEVGHLLGLVNLVYQSKVDHEDSEHKGHSNNEDSVMYWAIETVGVSEFISGDIPDDFDQDDRGDLEDMAAGRVAVSDQLYDP